MRNAPILWAVPSSGSLPNALADALTSGNTAQNRIEGGNQADAALHRVRIALLVSLVATADFYAPSLFCVGSFEVR